MCLCKPSHKFLKKRRFNRDESSRVVTFAEFLEFRVRFQFAVAEIEHRQSMFVATQRRSGQVRQRAVRLVQRPVERLGGEGMIGKVRRSLERFAEFVCRGRSIERRFVFRWQRNSQFQIAKAFLLFTVIAQFHLLIDVERHGRLQRQRFDLEKLRVVVQTDRIRQVTFVSGRMDVLLGLLRLRLRRRRGNAYAKQMSTD